MSKDDKYAKKDGSTKKESSPKNFSIKYEKHEKGESSVTREEEIIPGVIEEIIEIKTKFIRTEYKLIRVDP